MTASDPRASWVTAIYTQGTGSSAVTHGIRMKLGTAQALGLGNADFSTGYIMKQVTRKATTRRMYPGGPSISILGRTVTRAVAVGPRQGQARTNKRLYLRGKGQGQEAVIYFSGKQASAVAWLKEKSSINFADPNGAIGLFTSKGRPLFLKTSTD